MEPIVNPLYFYLIDVIHGFDILCIVSAIAFGIITFITGLYYITEIRDSDCTDKEKRGMRKFVRVSMILTIVFTIFALLSPNKQTAYQMLIAKYTTENNLEQIKNIALKIMEAAKGIIK